MRRTAVNQSSKGYTLHSTSKVFYVGNVDVYLNHIVGDPMAKIVFYCNRRSVLSIRRSRICGLSWPGRGIQAKNWNQVHGTTVASGCSTLACALLLSAYLLLITLFNKISSKNIPGYLSFKRNLIPKLTR